MSALPESWLRGPVAGVGAELQPVAHTLVGVREELAAITARLDGPRLWQGVADGWSVGHHVRHLAGSTRRLLAYADGRALTEEERAEARAEATTPAPPPDAASLIASLDAAFAEVMELVRALSATPGALSEWRGVGRLQLPSTVRGLLFHIAEHAQRHAGQVALLERMLGASTRG